MLYSTNVPCDLRVLFANSDLLHGTHYLLVSCNPIPLDSLSGKCFIRLGASWCVIFVEH